MCRKLLALFILAITLCGCTFSRPGTPGRTGFFAPYYISQANVPFADNLHTGRWDQVEKICEDSFGREYFLYRTYSRILQKKIDIHIISQKNTKDGNYYYYPELCYFLLETEEELTDEASEALKQQNDWERPLCDKKMVHINKQAYTDCTASADELAEALRKHFDMGDTYSVLANPMEILDTNTQMFFAVVSSREGEKNIDIQDDKYYYGIYDKNAPDSIVFCWEASGQLNCHTEITAFKEAWERSCQQE